VLSICVKIGDLERRNGRVFCVLLANVNSCSLYVVVRPSVVCLSVTFVHPTQPIEIFGNLRHLIRW